MERSWLQQQASLSKFDGYRDSEPFSKVKVTAAPAPKAYNNSTSAAPEAGLIGDVVFAPEEALADWSGFAPRNCPGRRMYQTDKGVHRETIARSQEHGIVPAPDTVTEDSIKTRRKVIAEPARAGEGLVLGGPEAPKPEERFTTAARAANAQESTPLELKSDEGCRSQKNCGKKYITPPYERTVVGHPGGGSGGSVGGGDGQQAGQARRAPLGDPLLQQNQRQQQQQQQQLGFAPQSAEQSLELFGSRGRAAAANGPGSFLKGMGRQMVGSGGGGSGGGAVFSLPGSRRERDGGGGGGAERGAGEEGQGRRREDGPRAKELYAANYNPYTSGYTGHQPRR